MAIETKEILEYLGLDPEKVKSLEDLKPAFDKEFVRTSNLDKDSPAISGILGKVYGSYEHDLKKVAKEFDLDIDYSSEEYKSNKTVSEKAKFIFSKLQEKSNSTISDLKSKSSQGNDDKYKDLEKRFEALKNEKSDVQGLLDKTKIDFDSYKQKAEHDLKSEKLSVQKDRELSKIEFRSDLKNVERIGFNTYLESKYLLDLSEDGKEIIPKTLDGKRIPSEKVNGEFKKWGEILVEEGTKEGLIKLNSDAGKQTPSKTFDQGGAKQANPTVNERKVADRFN